MTASFHGSFVMEKTAFSPPWTFLEASAILILGNRFAYNCRRQRTMVESFLKLGNRQKAQNQLKQAGFKVDLKGRLN